MYSEIPKYLFCVPAICVALGVCTCHAPSERHILEGLDLEGFKQARPLVVYNKDNIFDYIDGEAEVYFPFGFELLYSLSYRNPETDAWMVVDAYDMGTSQGALGVFGRFTEEGGKEIQGIGEAAWTDDYVVLFRRASYFFRIWPDPSSDSAASPGLSDMFELSRQIDRVW
jgi:hypothetical protein